MKTATALSRVRALDSNLERAAQKIGELLGQIDLERVLHRAEIASLIEERDELRRLVEQLRVKGGVSVES